MFYPTCILILISAIIPLVINKKILVCRNYHTSGPTIGPPPCQGGTCQINNGTEGGGTEDLVESNCANGWDFVPASNSCLRLNPNPGTFTQSRESCKALGDNSDLASVLTIDEFNYIKNNYNPVGANYLWIGLKDSWESSSTNINIRHFEWVGGEEFRFDQWATGEPDNLAGIEYCVAHEIAELHKWNDRKCNANYPSVCKEYDDSVSTDLGPDVGPDPEIQPEAETEEGGICGVGWDFIPESDSCLLLNPNLKNFKDARTSCLALGEESDLASVLNIDEFDFIRNNYNPEGAFYLWIGLKDSLESSSPDISTRRFEWVGGEDYEFQKWILTGQPANEGGISFCGAHDIEALHEWNDLDCNQAYPFVCKKYIGPRPNAPGPNEQGGSSCGPGWDRLENTDVCFFHQPHKRSFEMSSVVCQARGGELASVLSQDEFDFIKENYDNVQSRMLWIGNYDTAEFNEAGPAGPRDWQWLDGGLSQFSAWTSTEPSNDMGIQWCVAAEKVEGYKWNDQLCNKTYESVCKKTIANACGQDWSRVGDACFKPLETKQSYDDAILSCQFEGEVSEIASILSDQELEWVQDNVNPTDSTHVWIGYKDISTTGSRDFQWSDGSEKGYEAWKPGGEPDNNGGAEKCTALELDADHKWVDKGCLNLFIPLCKKFLRNGPGSEPTADDPCGRGWNKVGDRCFFYQSSLRTWETSIEACETRGDGSYLASILSSEENNYCKDNYEPINDLLWIGLYDENNSKEMFIENIGTRDFQWVDGADVDFTAWKTMEPDNILRTEWCTAMEGSSNHFWVDKPCTIKAGSICAKTIINECGLGWDQAGDACFKMISGSGSWDDRRMACLQEGEGSDLASILNDDEQDFIANNYQPSTGNFLWIGLWDFGESTLIGKANEGSRDFVWVDEAVYSYENFGSEEPNNEGGSTHCVALDAPSGHLWNDQSCSASYPAICKKYIRNAPARYVDVMNHPCGHGWDQVDDCCFMYQNGRRTFEKAHDACIARGDGSDFASILTENEFNFVRDYYGGGESRFIYMGLEETTRSKKSGYANRIYRDFEWLDGNPVDYTNWHTQEPNNWAGFQYCGSFDKQFTYQWNDQKCFRIIPSVCKKCLVSPCGQGWDIVGDACFKHMKGTATYDDALKACQAEGDFASLASETSQEEFDWVKNNYVATTSHLWIGLRDTEQNTVWNWEDFSFNSFTAWYSTEPNNQGGNDWCAAHKIQLNYEWSDENCDQEFEFVCKKYHQNRPQPPVDPGKPCGYGWDQIGTACFLRQSVNANWQNSRDACIAKGGDLASIHSSEEQQFIRDTYSFSSDRVWIGLYDENESRKQGAGFLASANFQWKDQSAYDYQEWVPGEPNNFYKTQFCVAMMTGNNLLWNDQLCTFKKESLCRKDLGDQPPAFQPAASCLSGWDQVGNSCFKHFQEYKNYGAAKTTCSNNDAYLATVSSDEELEHITTYFQGLECEQGYTMYEEQCYRVITTGGTWPAINGVALGDKGKLASIHSQGQADFVAGLTTNGNTWIGLRQEGGVYKWKDGSSVDFTDWDSGEPDTSKDCVLVSQTTGKWFTWGCSAQRKGIMQKHPRGNIWLGIDLTPRDPSGTWIWADDDGGSPHSLMWDTNEPNYNDQELCAVIWASTDKLRTVRCAHLNEFVCKRPAS